MIAHGVYGWVAPAVRDALLAAIAAQLAPDGIAFVSYPAYPGGYFRRMLREMGLFHARAAEPGVARAEAARELFGVLAELRADPADAYGGVLARELPRLLYRPAGSLVHDDLADEMAPVWFADFAAHAAAHGLAFVSEVEVAELRPGRLPDGVEPRVRELAGGDRLALEQYVDFLLGRKFRQSLLCHEQAGGRLRPGADPAARRRVGRVRRGAPRPARRAAGGAPLAAASPRRRRSRTCGARWAPAPRRPSARSGPRSTPISSRCTCTRRSTRPARASARARARWPGCRPEPRST